MSTSRSATKRYLPPQHMQNQTQKYHRTAARKADSKPEFISGSETEHMPSQQCEKQDLSCCSRRLRAVRAAGPPKMKLQLHNRAACAGCWHSWTQVRSLVNSCVRLGTNGQLTPSLLNTNIDSIDFIGVHFMYVVFCSWHQDAQDLGSEFLFNNDFSSNKLSSVKL